MNEQTKVPDATSILVVDDHQIVREGVRSVLAAFRADWTVSEAASGEQAVMAVRAKAPNLVIMDVTMPDASGFEVTSRLRKAGFAAPILMFTMHQSRRLDFDVKEAGAQGYVLKTQATEDLVRAINTLLAGGSFFGGASEPEGPLTGPKPCIVMFFRGFAPDLA